MHTTNSQPDSISDLPEFERLLSVQHRWLRNAQSIGAGVKTEMQKNASWVTYPGDWVGATTGQRGGHRTYYD